MRTFTRQPLLLVLSALPAVLFASHAAGQQASPYLQGVTGQPYSATTVTTHDETLVDGTKIHRVTKVFRARDSQGRSRYESLPPDPSESPVRPSGFSTWTIEDPVAGQEIQLDSRQRLAVVRTFPKTLPDTSNATAVHGVVGMTMDATTPFPTIEKLPPRTICGVYAEGTRTIDIVPAGVRGNDRPITTIQDVWEAPDLKISMFVRVTNPHSGETTSEVQNLSREEPAPELFQIPEGYRVVQQLPD
ncbi:MAG: hypothetical protein WA414_20790 [Acidobacteriaceae bacterium]|jgi:hypothetical protein